MTGVPFEMVIGRESGQADTVRKTMASGRLFSTNMHEYCRHMQYLLTDVYTAIYKTPPEEVEFKLTPMPRLEVESIADFKVLFEIGALTPDMSLQLSQVLLGRAAKPYAKVQPGQGADDPIGWAKQDRPGRGEKPDKEQKDDKEGKRPKPPQASGRDGI